MSADYSKAQRAHDAAWLRRIANDVNEPGGPSELRKIADRLDPSPPAPSKTLGQIAYEAWLATASGVPWVELSPAGRASWERAGSAVSAVEIESAARTKEQTSDVDHECG